MMYEDLTPNEVSAVLEQDATRFIDVRTVEEYAAGHVPGALNVPLFLSSPTGEMVPNPDFASVIQRHVDKDMPVIVGCKMGGRSAQAADVLCHLGFIRVSNMLGGFSGHPQHPGWQSLGLPVERETAHPYNYERLRAELD